ncbi:MAG TPA: hypothetical protein PKA38_03775 [Candidatus Levybacteria bacterium]|nr:hypothetical protein [Candidatus Levybacteria bacterium]
MTNLVESLSHREIDHSNLTAESFWDVHIANMPFYHGTSSVSLPQIRTVGLSPDYRLYPQSDAQSLASILTSSGDRNYFEEVSAERKIYIGTDLSRCIEYAQKGSEFMGEMFDQVNWLLENGYEDSELFSGIKQRLSKYFEMHTPALLVIDSASPVVRGAIQKNHPQLFEWMINRDAFVKEVNSDAYPKQYSEESNAWCVLDQMEEEFVDLAIEGVIPPADFQIIEGKDFQELAKIATGLK